MRSPEEYGIALLGWSIRAMDAASRAGRSFTVIAPEAFQAVAAKYDITFIPWDFHNKAESRVHELYGKLKGSNIKVAVPLFEETVEWAGYINSKLHNDPRMYSTAMSLHDKSLMKRKAQLAGLNVGLFEETLQRQDLQRFFQRLTQIHSEDDIATANPIHIKPFDQCGSVGHQIIRNRNDIEEMAAELFPCLAESHVEGQEFSCEIFVHNSKIQFLNITEYVRLGYSGFVPASQTLENLRPIIREHAERLIDGFGVRYGILHPEFFLTNKGTLFFGEVAARVPGGHILELIERAFGFNAFQAHILCSDPHTTEDELREMFPNDDDDKTLYAGCLMLYPNVEHVKSFKIPRAVKEHAFYEKYHVFTPFVGSVPERMGFGNHYGTIYFTGDNGEKMKQVLLDHEQYEYFSDIPSDSDPVHILDWTSHRKAGEL